MPKVTINPATVNLLSWFVEWLAVCDAIGFWVKGQLKYLPDNLCGRFDAIKKK